ncbi:MAG: class I SAM-dependent methyltransferase [Deltaproteobacteria bacterium]|nr:class I SAM-dependent methyltransferase [Deltaproteobacteria bacterium]
MAFGIERLKELRRNTNNKIIRDQFNKQAEDFSRWSVTQNKEYHQAYFTFLGMTPDDSLLDVACGSGEFTLFAASRIRRAVGIDISDRMIDLAQKSASQNRLTNVNFLSHDVSDIPCDDDSFSIVVCKSAFHHIHNYDEILTEMIRCCKDSGRISIQDIVAYENDHVNVFFEQIEKRIDISHHVTLSKDFIQNLYKRHNMTITSTFEVNVDLNFKEYLAHAKQSEESRTEIQKLLETGLNDREIFPYFTVKDGDLYLRRNVFLILGTKEQYAVPVS